MPPKAAIAAVRRQLTGALAASFCAMMSLRPASTAAVIACTPHAAKTLSVLGSTSNVRGLQVFGVRSGGVQYTLLLACNQTTVRTPG